MVQRTILCMLWKIINIKKSYTTLTTICFKPKKSDPNQSTKEMESPVEDDYRNMNQREFDPKTGVTCVKDSVTTRSINFGETKKQRNVQ